MRASDAERERAVARLRRHQAQGRLTLDELEERSAAAWAAVEVAELDALTADLPAEPQRTAAPVARRLPTTPGRLPFTTRVRAPTTVETAMAELVEHVAPALHACGYDLVERTADRAVFVNRRRPWWVPIPAVLLFPFGLLALMVRTEDRITVDLLSRGGDTVLVAQGVGPLNVRRAFAELEA